MVKLVIETSVYIMTCVLWTVTYHIRQVLDAYRVKLRNGLSGPEGDEVARQRVEDFANKMRPTGFLVRSFLPYREINV